MQKTKLSTHCAFFIILSKILTKTEQKSENEGCKTNYFKKFGNAQKG